MVLRKRAMTVGRRVHEAWCTQGTMTDAMLVASGSDGTTNDGSVWSGAVKPRAFGAPLTRLRGLTAPPSRASGMGALNAGF